MASDKSLRCRNNGPSVGYKLWTQSKCRKGSGHVVQAAGGPAMWYWISLLVGYCWAVGEIASRMNSILVKWWRTMVLDENLFCRNEIWAWFLIQFFVLCFILFSGKYFDDNYYYSLSVLFKVEGSLISTRCPNSVTLISFILFYIVCSYFWNFCLYTSL